MPAETNPDPKPAASETSASPKNKGKRLPIVLVAALMAAEGVGVFFVAKMLSGSPAAAHGDEPALTSGDHGDQHGAGSPGEGGGIVDQYGEVQIADCKPSNVMAGKLIVCHIRVSALVAAADLERTRALVLAKQARLEDCVNTVIRSAEPKHLGEPGLETIKRRLKHDLDVIFGDEKLVQKVLVPQLLQSGRGL